MTIRDLAHLLLTAQDINREVMIVKDGCYSDITNVRFENGIFLRTENILVYDTGRICNIRNSEAAERERI